MEKSKLTSLQQLLGKTETQLFFEKYWQKKILHNRGDKSVFNDLLDWNKFNNLLNTHDLAPHLRLSLNGRIITPEQIGNSKSRNNTVEISKRAILNFCQKKSTLICQDIHKMDKDLQILRSRLATQFGEYVGMNAYLTPKAHQGFSVHYDAHEVFVLQIEGSKNWELFGFTEIFPLTNETDTSKAPQTPISTLRLEKGDILYIPRGMWHQAYTTSEDSLHVSISVKCRNKARLMKWLVDQMMEDEYLRENLPIEFDDNCSPGYSEDKLKQVIGELTDRFVKFTKQDGLVDHFNRDVILSEPNNPMKFNFPVTYGDHDIRIDMDKSYKLIEGKHFIYKIDDQQSALYLSGSSILVGTKLVPLLEDMFKVKEFTLNNLIQLRGIKNIIETELVQFIQNLIFEGILEEN